MDNVRHTHSATSQRPTLPVFDVSKLTYHDLLQLAGPDMLIDGYDQYNQQENDVVDISPEDASEEQAEAPSRADDCMLSAC